MPKQRQAITLVEILVVIGIIAILVMLLLPAVQLMRETARKTTCQNNLRQTGIAIRTHESVKGTLPPGWSANAAGDTGWGWATFILPHLEQQYSSESATGPQSDSADEGMGGTPRGPRDSGNLRQQRGGPPPWAGGTIRRP
jgi:type II secretory pathway pseudopilin PulG